LLDALGHLREVSPHAVDHLDRMARELSAADPVAAGPAPLVREVLLVAIDGAGETVGDGCTALLRGRGTSAEVRAAVEHLHGLLELLSAVEGDR